MTKMTDQADNQADDKATVEPSAETDDAKNVDEKSVDARLRVIGRLVDMPVARDRRRRYWMVWLLWGMLGTALTFEGVKDGTWLAVAGILGGPFWLLFLVWPFLWLRDRLRARSLWAEDMTALLHDAGDDPDGTSTLIVVWGKTGAFVPESEWCGAFPSVRLDVDKVERIEAGTFPGVRTAGFLAKDLVAWAAEKNIEGTKGDLRAALLWCDTLDRATR